jgi:hypothetical protein
MSFRKEKKFRVTINDFNNFKVFLLQKGMKKLYEPRIIHSAYYDTKNLQTFSDSEEGTLPRKKFRVRWYNNSFEYTFEKKVSSIEGRFKTVKKLTHLSSRLQLLKEKNFDSQYGELIPSLQISYIRSYFELNSMRVTFDENINYQNFEINNNRIYYDPERVIEVKIPISCSDDYVEKYIPFPTSRFSKYSRGILLSTGQLSEF